MQSCLVVQLDQRYNVDEALADPYFDITEGQGCNSIDMWNLRLESGLKLRQGLRMRLGTRFLAVGQGEV